ncbi:hypothetical protein M378DRAFT_157899, partial [Amanita muscaria Koide BX008]
MPRFHPVLPDLPQRSVAELESLSIESDHQEETQIDLNDTRYPKLAVVRIRGACKISSFHNISSSLRVFDGTSRWPVSVPQIHLRRLYRLVLRLLDSESESPFSTFIEALSLPVLEELQLTLKGRAVT